MWSKLAAHISSGKLVPDVLEARSGHCQVCQSTAMRRQQRPFIVLFENCSWEAAVDDHEDTCHQCGWEALDGLQHFLLRKASFSSKALGDFELCFHYDFTVQDPAGAPWCPTLA
jgi:hypothetical protein